MVNQDEVKRLYYKKRVSAKQIAKKFGVSQDEIVEILTEKTEKPVKKTVKKAVKKKVAKKSE